MLKTKTWFAVILGLIDSWKKDLEGAAVIYSECYGYTWDQMCSTFYPACSLKM